MPGGPARAHDRALLPGQSDRDAIDLNCAAPVRAAADRDGLRRGRDELPAYLGGHGYFPAGLPELQAAIAALYDARGLPTDPAQVMVTPGALSGVSIVAQALAGRGDRVLVETPGYPNAAERIRNAGARLATTEVDPDGWDLDATAARVRQVAPRLAYLIPDFQNPTGLLMSDEERERYAAELRRGHVTPIVDESHVMLRAGGAGDAAAVRGVRPGHDHRRQREQGVLGRPAGRLGPRAARPDGAADPGPGHPRPRRAGDGAAGACCACSRTPQPITARAPRTRLREQRDALVAALHTAAARLDVPGPRRRALAVVRAARVLGAGRGSPWPTRPSGTA